MTTYRTPQGLIETFRRAGGARGRQLTGCYSIEGLRLVERALRAGAPLEAVLTAERLAASADPRHLDLFAALRAAACPVTIVADDVLNDLTEGRDLGPILGLVRMPPAVTLGELLTLSQTTDDGRPTTDDRSVTTNDQRPATNDELRATDSEKPEPSPNLSQRERDKLPGSPAPLLPFSPAPPLFLASADIVDPGNVGALTRTAHAAGAAALLAAGASDPFHPRATRIGRGSIFKLPVIRYETVAALLDDLRRHEVFIVAAVAGGGVPLPEIVWPARATAVLMGNEAEGLPPEVLAGVDLQVTIPMAEGVDSYSVNAAAAVLLYAAGAGRSAGEQGSGGAGEKEG